MPRSKVVKTKLRAGAAPRSRDSMSATNSPDQVTIGTYGRLFHHLEEAPDSALNDRILSA